MYSNGKEDEYGDVVCEGVLSGKKSILLSTIAGTSWYQKVFNLQRVPFLMNSPAVHLRLDKKILASLQIDARRQQMSVPAIIRQIIAAKYNRKAQRTMSYEDEFSGRPRKKIRSFEDEFSDKV